MDIRIDDSPAKRQGKKRGGRYQIIFDAITSNPGTWVSISLDDVRGTSDAAKQAHILQAAHHRGVRIQTRVQSGRIYVRMKPSFEGLTNGNSN